MIEIEPLDQIRLNGAQALDRTSKLQKKSESRNSILGHLRHFAASVPDFRRTGVRTEMVIKDSVLEQEEMLDGFYAYATSLDDEAALVLKARSFHHEIEHLFRTTKTHLDARPVYLSRQERIRSHFLVCFLALLLLKLLQKQLTDAFPEAYREQPLTVDRLIDTLQNLRFGQIQGQGYVPMFQRTSLTDQLQELAGVEVNKQIITKAAMNAFYRKVNKS